MTNLSPSGFLKIGASELEYRMIGPAPDQAPTIVMLHEGLGCVGLWGDFPEKLQAATSAGVFVYSRAGYGASTPAALPRPLDYMHVEALEVLPKLLDAIGFRRGTSGRAFRRRLDRGDLCRFASGPSRAGRRDDRAAFCRGRYFGELDRRDQAGLRDRSDLKSKLSRWHKDVDNAFYGWNGAWLDPKFRAWDISEYLAYIRVPVAILQGADDQYGTIRQIEIAREECYCPVDVTEIPGAGHSPHREAPKTTLDTISDFAQTHFIHA